MTTLHGAAASPREAFWTLDHRAGALSSAGEILDVARLRASEHQQVIRLLEHQWGALERQPDLALVLPVRAMGDGLDVVRPQVAAAIEGLLQARVILPAVFADPEACVHALARWSGGHVDHLLQIARRAVESTEPERVTVAAIERAGRALGVRLLARLRPEDLPRAVEVHQTHRIRHTAQDLRMLGAACVLTYGGEPVWWDVHPALQAEALLLRARQGRIG